MLVFIFARNCEIIMFREEILASINNLSINEVQSHSKLTDQYIKLTSISRVFFPPGFMNICYSPMN